MKQSFVVASSGVDGQVGATMTYGVPGGSASRHVVFDAPEDANGKALVTASASGGRCAVSITAGAGFAGRPLMFSVAAAADGCTVSEDANVPAGGPPPGGGVGPLPDAGPGSPGRPDGPTGPGGSPESSGISGGCSIDGAGRPTLITAVLVALVWLARRRRGMGSRR